MTSHRAIAVGLLAISTSPVRADPRTPQIAPQQQEREDAERIDAQRRTLDRPPASEGPVAPIAFAPAPDYRSAGKMTLGLGLAGSLTAGAMYVGNSDRDTSIDVAATVILVPSATAVIVGAWLASRAPVRKPIIAPVAGPGAVGLAITGRW